MSYRTSSFCVVLCSDYFNRWMLIYTPSQPPSILSRIFLNSISIFVPPFFTTCHSVCMSMANLNQFRLLLCVYYHLYHSLARFLCDLFFGIFKRASKKRKHFFLSFLFWFLYMCPIIISVLRGCVEKIHILTLVIPLGHARNGDVVTSGKHTSNLVDMSKWTHRVYVIGYSLNVCDNLIRMISLAQLCITQWLGFSLSLSHSLED